MIDDATHAAHSFLSEYFKELGGLGPARGSIEEQACILSLAAYIRQKAKEASND